MEANGRARGRRKIAEALSADQIAAAALVLLDKEGFEAFSVRNLAKALDASPASIYWHTKTRREVLAAAAAYVLRDLQIPDDRLPWQHWIRELCHRFRRLAQKHRALIKLVSSNYASNISYWTDLVESILRVLTKAGFAEANITGAFNVTVIAMLGFTKQELGQDEEQSEELKAITRARVNTVNYDQYPMTARYLPSLSNRAYFLRWDTGFAVPLDESFELYIDVVLQGLEVLLRDEQKLRSTRRKQELKQTVDMRYKNPRLRSRS